MSKTVTLGLIQMQCVAEPEVNRRRAAEFVRQAAAGGAQVICLPELFCSEYFCQTEDHRHFGLAESIPGPSTELLSSLAAELGVVIIGSLFERRAAGVFHNSAVVFDADGSLLGVYRKMHIPDDPQFYEKFYFTPGDLGFRVFRTRYLNVGTLICWDQWFPEAARATALQGADVLFYPTAIGWLPAEREEFGETQHNAWQTVQRSHAIANGCYVASVNRTGYEGTPERGLQFWGRSFAAAPTGRILAEAGTDDEQVLCVPVELDLIEEFRTHWPFLRDRRIDAYGTLNQRWCDDTGR